MSIGKPNKTTTGGWLSGQRACLILWRPEFGSCWNLHFYSLWKSKNSAHNYRNGFGSLDLTPFQPLFQLIFSFPGFELTSFNRGVTTVTSLESSHKRICLLSIGGVEVRQIAQCNKILSVTQVKLNQILIYCLPSFLLLEITKSPQMGCLGFEVRATRW